jgi:hypothetical protein
MLAAMRHLLHHWWQMSTVPCRASLVAATPVKSNSKHQGLEGGGQAGACAAACWRCICSATAVTAFARGCRARLLMSN